MKSSSSRQNSETRAEPFPKPRPQPIFPRRVGLHVPHTYNHWNAHHISGPCSYSAACAFQLWSSIVFPISRRAATYTALSQSSVCFHKASFSTSSSTPRGIRWKISDLCLYIILTVYPFLFNDCRHTTCQQGQNWIFGKSIYFYRLNNIRKRISFLDSYFSRMLQAS